MRILFCGDVVGRPGRDILTEHLPALREELALDLVIVNGENAAGGFGYSGKLWEAPAADFERYRAAVADYKAYRELLLGDYRRPTGQPASADEYAQVIFSDGGRSVTMEFNADTPGSASLSMD